MTSELKKEMPYLVTWIVMIPFLAAWPFLSAFPVFSLIGSTSLDLSTTVNVVFLLTGFWALAGGAWIISWLMVDRPATAKDPRRMLVIGGYAIVWTALYTAAAMLHAL